MNSNSLLCDFENPSFDKAVEASARAAALLNGALNRMALAKVKADEIKNLVGVSNDLISYSKKLCEKQNEIIIKCFDRLRTLEISSTDYHIIKEHLNGNHRHNGNLSASESKSLNAALEAVKVRGNIQPASPPGQYLEIDLNTAAETAFWCKKLNASRPEILYAMEQIQSKSWVNVWKYFLNKNKPAAVKAVSGTKASTSKNNSSATH